MNTHTDCKYFVGNIDIPEFADIIFMLNKLSDNEKIRFRDNFLYRYLDDENFRNTVEGGYIHILNNKIIGVYPTDKKLDVENKPPYVVNISSVPKNYRISYVGQSTTTVGNSSKDTDPIIVELDIKLDNDTHGLLKYTFDTGCFCSSLPFQDKWDFKTGEKYINLTFGSGRYSTNTEVLNNNILKIEPLYCKIPGYKNVYNKVTFINHLEISINKLSPIYSNVFIVQQNQPEEYDYLLGRDIIFLNTTIISSTNGVIDVKIYPSEINTFEDKISNPKKIFNPFSW